MAAIARPLSLAAQAPFEPFLTGPLLLALTRGSPSIQNVLVKPFESTLLARNRARRLSALITTLKWLFALGLASRANQLLSAFARNHWQFTQTNSPWKWDGESETVLITGGSSGFGHLMAKDFSKVARVIVIDVQDLPEDLKSNPKIHYYRCDLSSPTQISSTAASIKQTYGNPSVLINNAGIGTSTTILDASPEWLEKIFRVNLISHWQLVQEFLPGMLEMRKGHIVSVASVASYLTTSNLVDYSATKAGLLAFHDGLNQELRHRYPSGRTIRTTIIHPMWARTGIIRDWEQALSKRTYVMPPEAVTERIVEQVLSGRSGKIFVPKGAWMSRLVSGASEWWGEVVRDRGQELTVPGRLDG